MQVYSPSRDSVKPQISIVNKEARARIKVQKAAVLWFTGLSAAGKSTIASLVEDRLHRLGAHTMLLDGDNLRRGLNQDLGFSSADRGENVRRVAEVAKLMTDAGLIAICALISPFRSERRFARQLFDPGEFFEVFVDTPLETCIKRDPKGLYLHQPYEPPENPETANASPDAPADRVVELLRPSLISR